MDITPGESRPPHRAGGHQLSELLRDLTSPDWDVRDEATEELGRRLRGATGKRIVAYLQAAGLPSDRDAAGRLERLAGIRESLERLAEAHRQSGELEGRIRRLRRRVEAWEAYQEEAEPGTGTGAWVVENLAAIDRLLGLFRARISQLEIQRDELEETIGREQAHLDEMPGATRTADDEEQR